MIKFFRHIRQRLVSKNKFSKYLIYAIGEIILVVLGILIALQINQNAENKKTNNTRKDYYVQLLEDLNKDKQFANEIIKLFEKDREEYNTYLEIYSAIDLSPSQVYDHLMTLNIMSTPLSFNSNTIESLRSSGEIILIPLTIRNKLIDVLRFQEEVLKSSDYSDKGKNNVLQDLGIYRGASTLDSRLQNQSQLKSYLEFDKNMPQIILGLDAVQRWKEVSENDSISYLKLMTEDIDVVIDLIELELTKHEG
ncbi:hypothetical protein H8K90_06090 [Winogradskyella echinorum]|uniref:Uncharacterized protein n=1 Tax=Winogradskyella echinorum TaxID=538189 RepID=A0ABR6XZN8_9FLAO|nr:hypothetical protein [Winogradskyella echinorum]MBC3845940.1 hypothetical protein [Winogradskyella echinorum]MBC5750288.1 hypothetical protein [Winogradskyella echinorum]